MNLFKATKYSLLVCLMAFGLEAQSPSDQNQLATPKRQDTMSMGYNAPCHINVENGYDFFISGSFIYWEPIQENMKLGVSSNSSADLDLVNGRDVDLDWKYKPGFKVGLGMNFEYDAWSTFLQYTWFRGTLHARKSVEVNNDDVQIYPAWQIPDFLNPQYESASEKWTLRMHLIDWDLGRGFYLGKKLCVHPFIGLRGAFIKQNLDVDYTNLSASNLLVWPSTSVDQRSRSWGIGPRVGFASDWTIYKGLRLIGNGEVDILFTQYDVKFTQKSDVTAANRYIVKQNNANRLRTHLELGLGLGWGTYFFSNRYHIDLSLLYNFQVFFDQNVFLNFKNEQAIGSSISPNGNLYIHGLTIPLRFDF